MSLSGAAGAAQKASFGRIIDHLGSTLLRIVVGDPSSPSAAAGVAGIVIHDPLDDQPWLPRALVLGVGVAGAEDIADLLRRMGDQDGAGLIVREPVAPDEMLHRAATETGTVLLSLTRGASWNQLAALLRELLGEQTMGAGEPETLGGVPAGDLFAIANAIEALIDAPVTIEDRNSRLLAFSGRQDEADESRIETVLGRQVPERYLTKLEELGVFRQLVSGDRPVTVSPDDLPMPGVTQWRTAVAVRAGDEYLGSIWAGFPQAPSPQRQQILADAANLVALHLLRSRAGADVERRLVADLVATALEGGPGTVEALTRLGLSDRPLVVIALGLPGVEHDAEALSITRRETDRRRIADALAVHLSALHPGSVVATVGGVTYGLLPVARADDTAETGAARLAADFLDRTNTRATGYIGISRAALDLTTLSRARRDADRALRVLRQGRGNRRVARAADVYAESLLLELADLAAAEGVEHTGPIARLRAYDALHQAHLVESLGAWLAAGGDVNAASGAVHVHANTFRYRLRRIAEVGEIDLDDSESRFAAMLALRLLRD